MSVQRIEQIIAYGEAMVSCYQARLSAQERAALHAWDGSHEFTSTDRWPGWVRHIGLPPGVKISKPVLMRRSA